jgi:hypothetical protein
MNWTQPKAVKSFTISYSECIYTSGPVELAHLVNQKAKDAGINLDKPYSRITDPLTKIITYSQEV